MTKVAKTPHSNCVIDTSKAGKTSIGMRPERGYASIY
jgi:hypothetical protein